MKKVIKQEDYNELVNSIIDRIDLYRRKAALQLNQSICELYFAIGKLIIQKQKELGWGKSVVKKLSVDLKKLINSKYGLSSQNLWFMRQYYLEYNGEPELFDLSKNVPWGQNIVILSKIKFKAARKYYLEYTVQAGWSRNILLNQIKAKAFERQMVFPKLHNFPDTLPKPLAQQADEILKSSYNLEFINIQHSILEVELERLLVEKIKNFLLELGYGFSFLGNQYKLNLENKEYFIDLLFYHTKLKCHVAIELKIGEFQPEYIGKMNFYLNLINNRLKEKDDNPSLGIILCAEKNNIEVGFALQGVENPIGVSEYHFRKRLPLRLKKGLPSANEFKNTLKEGIEQHIRK